MYAVAILGQGMGQSGLTVVAAPNEAGKSTWAGFLKAMLYGIDTRSRDRRTRLADKRRFQPWSGRPMEGELELEWQGRDITLYRGPKGSTPWGNTWFRGLLPRVICQYRK